MSREFPEADWKRFRVLKDLALQRFCQRILDEVKYVITEPSRTAHERYGEVYRVMKERDKEVADAFDGMSRSNAFLQLLQIRRKGLLTDEEMAQFTPETRDRVDEIIRTFSKGGAKADEK